jgi:hypothetical protein
LRQKSIDRTDLHAGATAVISQFSRVDVILSIGN